MLFHDWQTFHCIVAKRARLYSLVYFKQSNIAVYMTSHRPQILSELVPVYSRELLGWLSPEKTINVVWAASLHVTTGAMYTWLWEEKKVLSWLTNQCVVVAWSLSHSSYWLIVSPQMRWLYIWAMQADVDTGWKSQCAQNCENYRYRIGNL